MSARGTFEVDGVTWTEYDWFGDDVVWQRDCPDCDHGLLLAPARFHGACGGSGLVVSHVDPRSASAKS